MAAYLSLPPARVEGITSKQARLELKLAAQELARWREEAVRRRTTCIGCQGVGLLHTCRTGAVSS